MSNPSRPAQLWALQESDGSLYKEAGAILSWGSEAEAESEMREMTSIFGAFTPVQIGVGMDVMIEAFREIGEANRKAGFLQGAIDGYRIHQDADACDVPLRWTREWPTQPGHYWFYGHRFKPDSIAAKSDPEMMLVEAWEISSGIMLVAKGHSFSEQEAGEGLWAEAVLPATPELSGLTEGNQA